MAYIPTEWETGDVITAAKLNNMEQGIEDAFVAPTFIEVKYDTSTQAYVLPSGATPPAESVMTAPIKPTILAPLPDTELTTDMVAELHYICHHKMMGADIYQFSGSFNTQNDLYSMTVTFAYMSGTFNTVNGWIRKS